MPSSVPVSWVELTLAEVLTTLARSVSLLIFVFVSVYMHMYDILIWLLKLNCLTSSFSRPNHQSGENLVCGLLS